MPDGRAGRPYRRWKRECFERDRALKSRCWRCKQKIDYTLVQGNSADPDYVFQPDAYEPDHKKAWHSHPALRFAVSNGAACHAKCNRAGGDVSAEPDDWRQAEADWD